MVKSGNCHLTTITVLTDSSKNNIKVGNQNPQINTDRCHCSCLAIITDSKTQLLKTHVLWLWGIGEIKLN